MRVLTVERVSARVTKRGIEIEIGTTTAIENENTRTEIRIKTRNGAVTVVAKGGAIGRRRRTGTIGNEVVMALVDVVMKRRTRAVPRDIKPAAMRYACKAYQFGYFANVRLQKKREDRDRHHVDRRDREKDKEKERDKDKHRPREKDKDRDRSERDRDRERGRSDKDHREKDRDSGKEKDKDRRDRDRDREREKDRDREREKDRDSDRDRERNRSRRSSRMEDAPAAEQVCPSSATH